MKYVFYDSESIDIKHKYSFSFGYLVTDDNFKVINSRKDIVFNPDIPQLEWDWWAYKKLLKYSYSQKSLQNAKLFPYYYKKIKSLFEGEDVICIGFEINEDIKYLLNNCERYSLEPINFKYIDVRKIIRYLTGKDANSLSHEYIKYTHKPYYDIHRSDVDAEMTMLVLRELLKSHKVKLDEVINKNKSLVGKVEGFDFAYEEELCDLNSINKINYKSSNSIRIKKTKEGRENFIDKWSKNDLIFIRFLDFVRPTCDCKQILKDKKICISLNYESTNFQNMLKLVQMITNFGGTYIKKGSMADIFVKQDSSFVDEEGKPNHCSRYDYVLKAIGLM